MAYIGWLPRRRYLLVGSVLHVARTCRFGLLAICLPLRHHLVQLPQLLNCKVFVCVGLHSSSSSSDQPSRRRRSSRARARGRRRKAAHAPHVAGRTLHTVARKPIETLIAPCQDSQNWTPGGVNCSGELFLGDGASRQHVITDKGSDQIKSPFIKRSCSACCLVATLAEAVYFVA